MPVSSQLTHLDRLEAEGVYIIREVAAQFRNPVMLYSIGKDSSVLLHLALKAFRPARLPFPVLHVDTTWKFREMIAFRDRMAKEHGFELIVHTNAEGVAQGINPFTHGSAVHTDVMKTAALKQALDKGASMRPWAARGATRKEPRQGARLFGQERRAPLGPAQPTAGAVEHL